MTTTWHAATTPAKSRQAHLKAFDLVEILDSSETTVTQFDIDRWRDDEVCEWVEAWGFKWNGEEWHKETSCPHP